MKINTRHLTNKIYYVKRDRGYIRISNCKNDLGIVHIFNAEFYTIKEALIKWFKEISKFNNEMKCTYQIRRLLAVSK